MCTPSSPERCDHFVKTQEEGIKRLRELIEFDPPQKLHIDRREPRESRFPFERLYEVLPKDIYRGINVRDVIKCIADDSYFSEYKRGYAPGRGDTIVCGKMWLKGIPVGVVASNGVGVIFIEAARKASEWMIRCANADAHSVHTKCTRVHGGKQEKRGGSESTGPIWSGVQHGQAA